MSDFETQRLAMVDRQIAGRGIADPALLAAMRAVPREAFVPAHLAAHAYDDSPLPIEAGQTISQPYIVALMIDAAGVGAGDRVLEIGAGSGYAAALLGRIARTVVAVERHGELADLAAARMARLGYHNVEIVVGDGSVGLPGRQPFDAILAAASSPTVPDALGDQLAAGGRLVMPVGDRNGIQRLVRLRRTRESGFEEDDLGAVRFVPLIGAGGWSDQLP
jgi:protein-L-isoaspartate(D-aspartate) O-methyltransferase